MNGQIVERALPGVINPYSRLFNNKNQMVIVNRCNFESALGIVVSGRCHLDIGKTDCAECQDQKKQCKK